MEYKQRLIGHFVFRKKHLSKEFDRLRNEIISLIDWPVGDSVDKRGCLWHAVSDYVTLQTVNHQINVFRWRDLYADKVQKKYSSAFTEGILARYQKILDHHNYYYDPAMLLAYPVIDMDAEQSLPTGKSKSLKQSKRNSSVTSAGGKEGLNQVSS